jgi:hypothetical protein
LRMAMARFRRGVMTRGPCLVPAREASPLWVTSQTPSAAGSRSSSGRGSIRAPEVADCPRAVARPCLAFSDRGSWSGAERAGDRSWLGFCCLGGCWRAEDGGDAWVAGGEHVIDQLGGAGRSAQVSGSETPAARACAAGAASRQPVAGGAASRRSRRQRMIIRRDNSRHQTPGTRCRDRGTG